MLEIRPSSLKEANGYVSQFHRHNMAVVGHKFSLSCYEEDRLCGVAIVGRPVARRLDDGNTLEITRVCTDGTRNANSILYGACARAAKALGYKKIITYTLKSESGASLRAVGFKPTDNCGGGGWDHPSRPREVEQVTLFGTVQKYPTEQKIRWEKVF